jgi:hypothetical protein
VRDLPRGEEEFGQPLEGELSVDRPLGDGDHVLGFHEARVGQRDGKDRLGLRRHHARALRVDPLSRGAEGQPRTPVDHELSEPQAREGLLDEQRRGGRAREARGVQPAGVQTVVGSAPGQLREQRGPRHHVVLFGLTKPLPLDGDRRVVLERQGDALLEGERLLLLLCQRPGRSRERHEQAQDGQPRARQRPRSHQLSCQ